MVVAFIARGSRSVMDSITVLFPKNFFIEVQEVSGSFSNLRMAVKISITASGGILYPHNSSKLDLDIDLIYDLAYSIKGVTSASLASISDFLDYNWTCSCSRS